MANIIAVLDAILKAKSNGNDPIKSNEDGDGVDGVTLDAVHHRIYECCRRIADHKGSNGHNLDGAGSAESALTVLLREVCGSKQSLLMLSPSLLTVWINEMRAAVPKSAAIGYLEVFNMNFVQFTRCTLDPAQWTLDNAVDLHPFGAADGWNDVVTDLMAFYSETMAAMHGLLIGKEQRLFERRSTAEIQRILHDLMWSGNVDDQYLDMVSSLVLNL